jgi:hypothetical protein
VAGTFVATLLAAFAAYLDGTDRDLAADRAGYRQIPLWLTDKGFDEMAAELGRTVQARLDKEPRPDRRRQLLTTIVMPDDRGDSRPTRPPRSPGGTSDRARPGNRPGAG